MIVASRSRHVRIPFAPRVRVVPIWQVDASRREAWRPARLISRR